MFKYNDRIFEWIAFPSGDLTTVKRIVEQLVTMFIYIQKPYSNCDNIANPIQSIDLGVDILPLANLIELVLNFFYLDDN